ncbi:MAG TPA: sigma-54 dependent transcriptional regulator [Rhodanobacteraceae bacterium]|nr:sigma-54 dependent transcriptional regulator [Rhodanobacteraceae bacterium]
MSSARILVVDDEPDIRELVGDILRDEGYAVELAADAGQARTLRREFTPELILLDIWMPKHDGISLLREWVEAGPLDATVIMMSGHGTIETAVEATRLGAWDFIEKPISLAKLLLTVQRALEAHKLSRQNAGLRRQLAAPVEPQGQSPALRQLRDEIERLAGLDASVLIVGERGTGKESLARWLHARSQRADRPFVVFGAAGLDREQARRHLFGHGTEPGLLHEADGGCLFLEEIADIDGEVQEVLAQAIERRSLRRVGDAAPHPLDLRLVGASTHEPAALLKKAQLREALYYALNVASLQVPPLRRRSEDVPLLLRHYAEHFSQRDHLPYRHFPVAVQNRLRHHGWPGNLRELRALVQRLLVMSSDAEVTLDEVEAALAPLPVAGGIDAMHGIDLGIGLREAREAFERDYLLRQLRLAEGSVSKLAQRVGLERTHLYRKLRDLGIELKPRDET